MPTSVTIQFSDEQLERLRAYAHDMGEENLDRCIQQLIATALDEPTIEQWEGLEAYLESMDAPTEECVELSAEDIIRQAKARRASRQS